jgi:flagellum-specific ATP synthase
VSWAELIPELKHRDFCRRVGKVTRVSSLVVEASGPPASIGDLCTIEVPSVQAAPCFAEVVGLRDRSVLLMPFGETRGIGIDSEVVSSGRSLSVAVGDGLLGRVIDPFGRPLDGRPVVGAAKHADLRGNHRNPLSRRKIANVFETGVRAVDCFVPVGKGQRIGIFSGSGVGKSTLLGMIARSSRCDVNVIALIGERGREVGDFLAKVLGPEGLSRSVVVVATSDQPALTRELAAHTATTIAEHFSEAGKDVLLIMDSVTRFAMAHREIGLAVGEPATARGYTPSAFAALPRLLERAGAFEGRGSITGIYTVLVEGDDLHEPVSDHMRAILDGHIVLSRDLANHGHFPAIDVLKSISRLSTELWSKEERDVIQRALRAMSLRERHLDMIEVGAYRPGSNPELDKAIELYVGMERFLAQGTEEVEERRQAFAKLGTLLGRNTSR